MDPEKRQRKNLKKKEARKRKKVALNKQEEYKES
jgi:hypothetical protein